MQKLLLLLLLFFTQLLYAQEATTASSGTGQAGNIILDWSVGELTLVNTVQNSNLMFTQGLHQGKLTKAFVTGTIGDGELIVTPNPTPSRLNIQIGFFEAGTLTLSFYDAAGKLLIQSVRPIAAFGTTSFDLTPYAGGTYLLQAIFASTNGDARKRTYKVLHLH